MSSENTKTEFAAIYAKYGVEPEPQPDEVRREAPSKPSESKQAVEAPWPVMAQVAYYGLAGDMVRTMEPYSEADPVALLLQFLALAGNVIGREPYYQVEADRHRANLFQVLVGVSAKGRKGLALGRAKSVLNETDPIWIDDRLMSGLSSGEGLISEVRDSVQKWNHKENQFETVDPGVKDKRLMVVEPEFASVLSAADRGGNTLTQIIRRAWDGDKLRTLTKNSPLCATGAHISIIGHITEDELRARLMRTDMANGFANRFLFALIRRSKVLPFGGDVPDAEILRLGSRFTEVLAEVRSFGRITMTPAARNVWMKVYGALSAGQPGLLGAVTARAEAQVVRLALIYALLDSSNQIDQLHMRAALAVWEYAEASAAHIFGNAIGDPVADEILTALKQAGAAGMSRTAIRDLFGRNKSADRIGAALALLMTRGRVSMQVVEAGTTGGRPTEMWFAKSETRHG